MATSIHAPQKETTGVPKTVQLCLQLDLASQRCLVTDCSISTATSTLAPLTSNSGKKRGLNTALIDVIWITQNHKILMFFFSPLKRKIESPRRRNSNFHSWVTRLPIEMNVHVAHIFWRLLQIPAFSLLPSKMTISNSSPLQGRRVNRLPCLMLGGKDYYRLLTVRWSTKYESYEQNRPRHISQVLQGGCCIACLLELLVSQPTFKASDVVSWNRRQGHRKVGGLSPVKHVSQGWIKKKWNWSKIKWWKWNSCFHWWWWWWWWWWWCSMGVVVLLRKSQLKHLKTIENRCFADFAQQMWDVSTFLRMFVSRLAVWRERLEVQTVRFVCDSGKLATTIRSHPPVQRLVEQCWVHGKNTYQIVRHQNIFHFLKNTPHFQQRRCPSHRLMCSQVHTGSHTDIYIYIYMLHIYIYIYKSYIYM